MCLQFFPQNPPFLWQNMVAVIHSFDTLPGFLFQENELGLPEIRGDFAVLVVDRFA